MAKGNSRGDEDGSLWRQCIAAAAAEEPLTCPDFA